MKIREVHPEDFDMWLELRYSLWPYHTIKELRTEMEEIYKRFNLDFMVYVAEDNGNAVGLMEVSIKESALGCKTNNVGFIEGWYVKPQYRQQGIGRLLVEKGEAWAIEKGCLEMGSDTTEMYPISPIAHKLLGYEEVGTPLNYKKTLV